MTTRQRCHRDRRRRHPQAHPLRRSDRRPRSAARPPGVPGDRPRLRDAAGLDARPRAAQRDRGREHRVVRRDADPGADQGRRTSRRGQPAQPAGPTDGRQVRPPRRRADRPRCPRPDLDRDPEGQVRHGRGDPHPARHPDQRGQGPHPGVQHALGRDDRRTVAAARRAGRADQADPGQPLPAAAPRDRRPPLARRRPRSAAHGRGQDRRCATWPAAGRRSTTRSRR